MAAESKGKDECTYIMIKPDGVERGLIGPIITRFEQKGFYLAAMKLLKPDIELAKQHYIDLASKPFYKGLTEFLSSGPVVAMVWVGKGVVKTGRKMLGATMPEDSDPGTIRGDFCIDVGRNVIHGSDSVESAHREIAMWFPEQWDDNAKKIKTVQAPTRNAHVYEK